MTAIPGASYGVAAVNGQKIAYARMGNGPPVLLLHGFPQTQAMWHGIAPGLAMDFTVIAADLRGYGESSKPIGVAEMSFRRMAADQVALMASLGFDRFHLVGHDRGARVSHRLALDHDCALSLTVMDIAPTHLVLTELTYEVARAYYHWFFLAQPSPFPERLIGRDPDYYYECCLMEWDRQPLEAYNQAALGAYRASWRKPETIRGMCDDYRAALTLDLAHDRDDLPRRIEIPALVLYGEKGIMAKSYDMASVWERRLANMSVRSMPGGHFFPDLHPVETLNTLREFLVSQ